MDDEEAPPQPKWEELGSEEVAGAFDDDGLPHGKVRVVTGGCYMSPTCSRSCLGKRHGAIGQEATRGHGP